MAKSSWILKTMNYYNVFVFFFHKTHKPVFISIIEEAPSA